MIAKGFAANGAKVYITGRRREVIDQVANAWKEESGSIISCVHQPLNDDQDVDAHTQITHGCHR